MSVALNVPAGTAEDVSDALKAFRAGTGSVPLDLYVERYARLVWAVATMIARNVPWRTMSHDPATGAIVSEGDMTKPVCMDVVVYAHFVDIVHHQEDRVATQRLRAVEAETALRQAYARIGRLERDLALYGAGG